MGYLSVTPASAITFGLPAPIQTLFLVDSAINRLVPEAEDRVRKLLSILDNIECKMVEWQDYLAASKVDNLEIRPDNIEQLEWEYSRWASRLADELGAPLYPGSTKFRKLFQTVGAGNIPVKN